MTIFIEKYGTEKLPKEQTVIFSKPGWVAITDRENGEHVGMIRMSDDYGKNTVLAAKIIELIEGEINGGED